MSSTKPDPKEIVSAFKKQAAISGPVEALDALTEIQDWLFMAPMEHGIKHTLDNKVAELKRLIKEKTSE